MQSPIFGQGFGGWQSGFSRYADEWNEGFPPHNTLVYLWSQSGIFAVLLALLFMVSVLHAAIKLMRIGGKDDYFLGLSLLMTSFWLFVQGMGENWGLVGEAHQEVLFAVLLAMVNVRLRIYASAQQAVEHRAIPQRQIRQ
jgi:O-antigen ligase